MIQRYGRLAGNGGKGYIRLSVNFVAMALTAWLLLVYIVATLLPIDGAEGAKKPRNETYRLYQDMQQPVEERVKDLLWRMTLAEKIGQMTQTERSITNHNNIRDFGIGGYACFLPTQQELCPKFHLRCCVCESSGLSDLRRIRLSFVRPFLQPWLSIRDHDVVVYNL